MKQSHLLYLGILLSLSTMAQVSSPLQNFISAGGATGTPHSTTSIPTHFFSIGQPMVIPRESGLNSGGGVMFFNEMMFSVTGPAITAFTPSSGPIGTPVIITGANFSATVANNIVKFNGTASIVTISTANSITTAVPTGSTTGKITVEVGGQTATSSTDFTVSVAGSPTIASFTPASGPIATSVTISGANFSTTAANNIVKFNGIVASITGIPTASSITTTVPTGATTGKITVEVGGLIATSSSDFTVTATGSPTITVISPITGPVGTTVSITGTNFNATAANNIVKFNGTPAVISGTPTVTNITTTVPAGATTGKITVEVGGLIATSTSDFTVTPAGSPTITSFEPNTGPVGTTVTIAGTNFGPSSADNTVKFNGTAATVTASTLTSITTSVPTGATTGVITVTVSSETATSATNFTVTTCSIPGKPIITASSLDTVTPTLTSSSSTGNQWFLNGVAITGATNNTFVVTTPGIYNVKVTVAGGCASELSESYVIIVTGDIGLGSNALLKVYPNPIEERIVFETNETGPKTLRIVDGTGRLMGHIQFDSPKTEVDARHFVSGLYYFMLTFKRGTATGKLVKK